MRKIVRWITAKRRLSQGFAAAGALFGALVLAVSGVAVFRSSRVPDDISVWRLVFADHATTGFLRLATISLALYAIASSAALIVGGRWLRGLSSTGLQMDDARASEGLVDELRARARSAEQARDEAIGVAREVMRWLNQT
ncbi:MAG: hypothetical protein WEB06_13720 [Actinomycetota bacterium]